MLETLEKRDFFFNAYSPICKLETQLRLVHTLKIGVLVASARFLGRKVGGHEWLVFPCIKVG
jgi:hypothetical protein